VQVTDRGITTMKLYASGNSDLMEVSAISRDGSKRVVEGIIMGYMYGFHARFARWSSPLKCAVHSS